MITAINDEKEYIQVKLTDSNKDRDETRADNKEMADNKNKSDKERMRFGMKIKLDHNRMTEENKKLSVQVDAGINEM